MKKWLIFSIFVLISAISFGQVSEKPERVEVVQLASNTPILFGIHYEGDLNEKDLNTGLIIKQYGIVLYRLSDGKVFTFFGDKETIKSALNNDKHYFYTDGKKIFIMKKVKIRNRFH